MSNLKEDWFDDASKTTEAEVVPEKNKLHLKKGDDVDLKRIQQQTLYTVHASRFPPVCFSG